MAPLSLTLSEVTARHPNLRDASPSHMSTADGEIGTLGWCVWVSADSEWRTNSPRFFLIFT